MPVVCPVCQQVDYISHITIDQEFSWLVPSYTTDSIFFSWEVGTGPLHWYVVEFEVGDTCPNLGYVYSENITLMGSSTEDICKQLANTGISKKIISIKKWTTPALVCDQKHGEALGVDYSCNQLVDVDYCVRECSPFINSGECLAPVLSSFSWRTEYLYLSIPEVSVGQTLIRGQKIGNIGNYGRFHFGITDGQFGGLSGQTLDVIDFFAFPATGVRPVVALPNVSTLTVEQQAFAINTARSPIDLFFCDWEQDLSVLTNSGYEYYAIDLVCGSYDASTASVYNICGGSGVVSTVLSVTDTGSFGWLVIINHTLL
jgi:hypothetical protein